MTDERLPHLSPAELEIMKILWRDGRLGARELHDRLPDHLGWAYSTTRTITERLVAKGAVDRAPAHGILVYRPQISRASGLARMVRDFAAQVLESSHVPVVSLFAESGTLTQEEVDELADLLEEDPEGTP